MAKSNRVQNPSCPLSSYTNVVAVITQCSMRHLYKASAEPGGSYLIDKAKNYERRRCGHHPDDYPEPLSAKDCLASVVDPKDSKTNKNRYVVASQELEVRKHMRGILGVPLVYINRSVMIMEPMAGATVHNREKEEGIKFRAGLKRGSGSLKRKREDEDTEGQERTNADVEDPPKKKKKAVRGPKGPNPLAVKKSKKKVDVEDPTLGPTKPKAEASGLSRQDDEEGTTKRKRKRRTKAGGGDEARSDGEKAEVADDSA
jgi:U3 small nucleolar RNA-associated protein 23